MLSHNKQTMILKPTIKVLLMVMICGSGTVLCDDSSERFILDPDFSNMTSYISTEDFVENMAMDQYMDGNLLFSDGASLKTTNGVATEIIAGQAAEKGFVEGSGEAARFSVITGFHQINSDKVAVVDNGNHCLRVVHRLNGQSEPWTGSCTEAGYRDGSDPLFSRPACMIADNQDKSKLLVTEMDNKAVRHVDSTTGDTATFYKDTELSYLWAITQDTETGDLYLTAGSAVYRLSYHDKTLTRIVGTDQAGSGFSDGDFSVTQFRVLRDILLIDNKEQILLTGMSNSRLRVLDLVSNTTTSICSGPPPEHKDGDIDSCSLHSPMSLLALGDSMYIGTYGRIRLMPGRVHATTTNTPATVSTAEMATTTNTPATVSTAEMSVCARGNVTKQLLAGEKTVDVEMGRGQISGLPVGEHMFMFRSELENCTVHVSVVGGSRLSSTEIVAIVVASVAFIAFLITLAILLVKMKKQGKGDESEMRQITDTKIPLMNEDKGGVM